MHLHNTRIVFGLVLLSFCCFAAESVSAQSQIQTVKGKTKDGKEIKVDYYKGTVEDYVDNVKYQLVDELQSKVRSLENELSRRDQQLDTLYNILQGSEVLDGLLSMKEIQIDSINTAITALNVQIDALQTAREKLMAQQGIRENMSYEHDMSFIGLPLKTPVIGLSASVGPVVPDQHGDGMRVKDFRWQEQASLYFGTARWGKFCPISLEIGLGWRSLTMLSPSKTVDGGVTYFNGNNEKLELTSAEIPVMFCIGQPASDRITAYARLGATPSFRLSSDFTTNMQYVFYGTRATADPPMNIVPEPDSKEEVRPFNVWAHLAFGTYIPLSCLSRARYASNLVFKAGIRCEYSVMDLLEKPEEEITPATYDEFAAWRNLKVYLPALEIGVVYTLK